MKGIRIKGFKKLTKNKHVVTIDKPEYVYIPLIVCGDEDFALKIRKGSRVSIGSVVALNKKYDIPVFSSVSGKVIDYKEMYAYNGKLVKTIIIKNDMEDNFIETVEKKDISNYTKEEFIDRLKECGIRGCGGADFPTYIKYDNNNIKNLIVNAVECEPYITADFRLVKSKAKEILEAIDAITSINKVKHAYIAVKKNNKELIKAFESYIGPYPKIKIVKVPNIYPMGWEKNLVHYILHKKYKKLPIEVGAVVNNVSTIYDIYNALKTNMPPYQRLVTVVGDGLKKSTNVEVRMGVDVTDIILKLGYKKKELLLISGGPMMGRAIGIDDLVISPNLNSILLMKNYNVDVASVCMRCGRCASVCPVGLTPAMIKENLNDPKELKKMHVEKCIECGLCSYICPAKILLREQVIRAKKNVGDN